jgi:hypothetical protein
MSSQKQSVSSQDDTRDTREDHRSAGSGKVANDHNQTVDQPSTQTNQGRRTPESRHDRESNIGSGNQAQSRRGAPGSSSSGTVGGGTRGAG